MSISKGLQQSNLSPQPFNPNNESYGRRVDARDGSIWPRIDTGFRFTPAPHPPIQPHPSRYSLRAVRAITRSASSQVQPLDAATNRERVAKLQQAEWAIERDHDEHRVFDSRMLAKPVSQRRIAGVFNKMSTPHPDYGYSKPLYGTTTQADAVAGGWGNFDPEPLERAASAGENPVHPLRPGTGEASYREETLGREGTRPYRILVASTTLGVSVRPLPSCEGYGVRFAARDANGKGKTRAKTEEVATEPTETVEEETEQTTDRVDYLNCIPRHTRSAPAPVTPAARLGWFPFRWFPIVGALDLEMIDAACGGTLPLFDRETASHWIRDLSGHEVGAYSEKRKEKACRLKAPYVVWPPRRKSPFSRERLGSPLELRPWRYAWNLHSPLRTVADHAREAERVTFSDREEAMAQAAVKDGDPLTLNDVTWDVEFDWHPIVDQKKKRAEDFVARQRDKDYLTPYEREQGRVAALMLEGLTQEQIALRLGMNRHKVRDRIAEVVAGSKT